MTNTSHSWDDLRVDIVVMDQLITQSGSLRILNCKQNSMNRPLVEQLDKQTLYWLRATLNYGRKLYSPMQCIYTYTCIMHIYIHMHNAFTQYIHMDNVFVCTNKNTHEIDFNQDVTIIWYFAVIATVCGVLLMLVM